MRSASPHAARLAVAAVGASLLAGVATGCETTQEKAAAHRAEAERILEARAKRQAQKKQGKENSKPDEKGGETR